MNEMIYLNMIQKFKKTKELINFAMQLEASIKYGKIKPENFMSEFLVGEGDDEYKVSRDWTKEPDVLKNDAITAKIALANFSIIMCKESYAALFQNTGLSWATKNDTDLYAAQRILKLVRNALGHMRAMPETLEAEAVWDFQDKKDIDLFEVKSINVVLDTRNLQDQRFGWNHVGGLKKFIAVLTYLENDLLKKVKKNAKGKKIIIALDAGLEATA